jgi:hypothetical protein
LNIGILLALLLSGGGGSLAASLCPHADCAPAAGSVMMPAAEHHGEASGGEHHGHAPEVAEDHHLDASPDMRQIAPPATRQGVQSTHDRSCDHCVARRPAAPASELERRLDAPKRDDRVAPAPSARPVSAPAAAFVSEVTPHQGAPPGRISRHILNNVFRI